MGEEKQEVCRGLLLFVLELNNKYLPKLKSMAKIDRNG